MNRNRIADLRNKLVPIQQLIDEIDELYDAPERDEWDEVRQVAHEARVGLGEALALLDIEWHRDADETP